MRSSSAITSAASSMSCCSTASIVFSSAWPDISRPPSAWVSSSASCSRKRWRVSIGIALSELAGDVLLGLLVLRVGEDLLGLAHLDELTRLTARLDVEERRVVAGPAGLLHVVGDDHD